MVGATRRTFRQRIKTLSKLTMERKKVLVLTYRGNLGRMLQRNHFNVTLTFFAHAAQK